MEEPVDFNEFKAFMNECRLVTYRIELSNEFEPDLIYVHESGKLFYNVDTGHFLHPYLDHKGREGRYRVDMWIGGRKEQTIVSRVVANAFMFNPKNKEEVHHLDGDKRNNEYCNLIYVTPQEHKELHRLMRNGEDKKYWRRINRLRKDSPFYTDTQPIFP